MTRVLRDIRHWAAFDPDKPALVLDDGYFSYRQFSDLIQQARALLVGQLGDGGRGIISIHMQHLARAWVWTIAARSLGFDAINADVRSLDPPPVAFITDFEETQVAEDAVQGCKLIGPSVSVAGLFFSKVLPDPGLEATGNQLLLSSGTTGRPKIVLFDEQHHNQAALEQHDVLGYNRNSIVYCWVFPLHTAVGYRSPVMTWGEGGTVILGASPQAAFRRFPVTSAILTPGVLHDILADPQGFQGSGDFRLIVTGGPIGWSLAARAKAASTEDLWSMYGSTEVGAACMTKIEAEPDTYRYKPVDASRIKILSDEGEDLPAGLAGNIWIQVHNGTDFYVGDPTTSQSFFRDGWFKTGDLGSLGRDGRLEILGRSNDVLIIRGDKQPSGPLERQITEALGRNTCVFSSYRSDAVGELIVVLEGSTQVDPSDVALVEEVVAELGMPYRVTTHDVFPRNGMGKVIRSNLITDAHLF